MPSLIAGHYNRVDAGATTIEASSTAGGLSVAALRTEIIGEYWRSGTWPAGGLVTLTLDLGAVVPGLGVFALAAPMDGVLPPSGALVRCAASATAKGNMEAYDGGLTSAVMPRGVLTWVPPAPVAARYVQWRFLAPQGVPDTYLQMGRAWVGSALIPEQGPSPDGYTPSASDDDATAPRRREQFQLPGLTEAEADALEKIGLDAGTQRQVLVIPRTERANLTAVFGRFASIPRPTPLNKWGPKGRKHSVTVAVQGDR